MNPKKALLAKRTKPVLSPEGALSTGSTLLNLACTDRPHFGYIKGSYYLLAGDSTSGKTWLAFSCFAEACQNKHFQEHRLIFDDVESGALMDVEAYFGKETAKRVETVHSETVEDLYYRLSDLIKKGDPFIYAVDSQDALGSKASRKKFGKQKNASESGEKAAGSMGDGKAKFHSENIRWVVSGLKRTGSILIFVAQTRDNLQAFTFEKKIRSGGKALRFYATAEIWTSLGKPIKKEVRGKDRQVGTTCIAEVRKNRITGKTGKNRAAIVPIYDAYGIDDMSSCVNFLIAEEHWPKLGGGIFRAPEFKVKGTRKALINYVEKKNLEDPLREIVASVWNEIEKECQLTGRKKRYQ